MIKKAEIELQKKYAQEDNNGRLNFSWQMILIVCAVGGFFFICGISVSCYAYCEYKKSKAKMIEELEEMKKFDGISGAEVLQGE